MQVASYTYLNSFIVFILSVLKHTLIMYLMCEMSPNLKPFLIVNLFHAHVIHCYSFSIPRMTPGISLTFLVKYSHHSHHMCRMGKVKKFSPVLFLLTPLTCCSKVSSSNSCQQNASLRQLSESMHYKFENVTKCTCVCMSMCVLCIRLCMCVYLDGA